MSHLRDTKASPIQVHIAAMRADQIIAFADSLRTHALASGRDINSANLFVHTVLVRTLKHDGELPPHAAMASTFDGRDRPDARL